MLPTGRKAFLLSCGKDSLAALFYLKAEWGSFDIFYADTGNAPAEHLDLLLQLEAQHGLQIRVVVSDVQTDWIENGYPRDTLPIWLTKAGRLFMGTQGPLLQSTLDCCQRNLWLPLWNATAGYDVIIRGQRNSDLRQGVPHGTRASDGRLIWLPIADWTDLDVHNCLADNGVRIPSYYAQHGHSIDCLGCTGYDDEMATRWPVTQRLDPAQAQTMLFMKELSWQADSSGD